MADLAETKGPIIVWFDLGQDGWEPHSYPTIEEAIRNIHFGKAFIITRKLTPEDDYGSAP